MRSQTKKKQLKENNGMKIRQFTVYEPDFKRAVVSFAEEKGTSEAKKRYGVSDSCIRRWRKIENKRRDIIEPTVSSDFQQGINKKMKKEFQEQDDLANKLDSMPLNERLKNTQVEQEPFLQSQPLSPTKLKVTRQSKLLQNLPKPPPVSESPPPPLPVEEISLKWNSYQSNMQSMFPHLLSKEQYVDVTLVAEGQNIKCHRVILSSCSPYFEETLNGISPFQHPVIFMKDVPFWILKTLCDFMYTGEVQILQTKLEELLAVAENLKIKGLAEKENHNKEEVKEIKDEPSRPIKQEKVEEICDVKEQEKEKELPKREMREKRRRSIPTHIPLLKCERLKLLHNSEKALLKRFKVQFKNSQKKSEPPPPKNVIKEPLSKTDILDPYDLLEPVYEEVQKETKLSQPSKSKESKSIPAKKNVTKRVKKRKISDDRDESPSPILTKKGTRSRPLKKMAKFSDTEPPNLTKEVESPIVREPHTSQPNPLIAPEDIKTEPLDLDENIIEIEDNIVGFSDNIALQEEDIIGNYESLLVNFKSKKKNKRKSKSKNVSKKPSALMNVHDLVEKDENLLKIVDMTDLKGSEESRHSDFLEEDPLNISQNVENITITNVQSLVETKEDSLESMCNEMGFRISEIRSQTKESIGKKTVESEEGILGFEDKHEEKLEIVNEKNSNEESLLCTQDTWNINKSSTEDIVNVVDTDTSIQKTEMKDAEYTTNDSDKNQSETTSLEDRLEQTENSVIQNQESVLSTSEIDTLENDNTLHINTRQTLETPIIRVIAIEQLEIQSNENEPMERNTRLEILNINESLCNEIQDNTDQNRDAANSSVIFEDQANDLNEDNIDEGNGTQLEIEHNSNPEESDDVTFQYNLDYIDNSMVMPKYNFNTSNIHDAGIPLIQNQNKCGTPEESNYNVDNLSIENDDTITTSETCAEETLTSNVDNIKSCEESISELESEYYRNLGQESNINLKESGSNEESCSQNIATYTSPTFHITQIVSEPDNINEDSFKYFKGNENSYVDSQLDENVDPMTNEIDTIVNDLTQIVGESHTSSSGSNLDTVQEDIEESLANLLK